MNGNRTEKVAVVGAGNAAWFFQHAVPGAVAVPPRTLVGLPDDADLYILAVSDDAIARVAQELPQLGGVVAHCSGTAPLDVLAAHKRRGVVWPMQTLTRGRPIKPEDVPLVVEGDSVETAQKLEAWARKWGCPVTVADGETRRRMHLASVVANNFTNHLWAVARQIMLQSGQSPQLLRPIMAETLRKALDMGPEAAQTGPARRRDGQTMSRHLEMLTPEWAEIYRAISEDITSQHSNA